MRKLLLIMKITTLLLVAVILHVSAATSLAQKVSLNEKNTALVDIFNKISNQTGYDFAFSTETLENTKAVTVNVKNEELTDVLTKIFQGQNLEFSLNNKIVTVKPKETGLVEKLASQIKAELSQVIITARVFDEFGQPLPGVTVKIKNTTTATATDLKGAFSITAPDNTSILVFSYVGYETKELLAKDIANGQAITLVASVTNLHEVSIDKGYYRERQELLTGNVTVIDGATIAQQPGVNPIDALEGHVAGLYISQTSGIPGANEAVRIRGQNSISNGNNPLYIVDGVPFGSVSPSSPFIAWFSGLGTIGTAKGYNVNSTGMSPFSILNPDDIENIEVLKDADATAIYGSRGANGVILITTKKGKAGTTKVNVDLSQGIGQVGHFMNLLNTQQYLQMRHQAFANDKLTPGTRDYDINGTWDTTRYTNWQKVLIGGTAHYTNAQGSVSGGTENTQFYISGGYKRETTVYPGDYSDQQGSLHFTLNHSSSNKRFIIQLTASYQNDNIVLPQSDFTATALTLAPDAPPVYNPNGSLNWQPVGGTATWVNPLAPTLNSSAAITNNLVSNMRLNYQVIPGLNIGSNFGYTDVVGNQTSLTPASSFAPPDNTLAANRNSGLGTSEIKTWIIEPKISYDKKIGRGILDVLIGASIQQTLSNADALSGTGFSSDALIVNPQNATTQSLFYTEDEYRRNSLYTRLGYTWDSKYMLNMTANHDGSSRFGPSSQYGNFGSAGAGWIFSKEKFVADNLPWLNFGKLRASYGITGSDQIADYQYLSTYTTNTPTYQGATGLYPTRIPNPYYGWETDKKLEGGIELGFLKDRINLAMDYFRNRSGNQLLSYGLPSLSGFSTVTENLPAMIQNSGTEFELHTINIRSTDFNWTSSFNLSIPENKLVAYPGLAASSLANRLTVGQAISSLKEFHFVGVDPQTGILQYASSTGPTNNPSYPQDLIGIVSPTQRFYGGLDNTFQYKKFRLDIFLQFTKQTALNYIGSAGYYVGTKNTNWPTAILNHWQNPGDIAPYGKFSTTAQADPNFNYGASDAAYSDASFIRLKNVELSYTLPQNWQYATGMQNARVYLRAQNLFTLTNYLGMDPETGAKNLPPLRMIDLGISATF